LVNNFILNCYDPKTKSKKEDWQKQRSLLSKHFFRAFNRTKNAVDNSFDLNQPLPTWPRPSKFDGIWFDGMSPESIKDPVIRAGYQKDLDEFWDQIDWYNNQKKLRKLVLDFIPKIQNKILKLYSGPEFDSKNLEIEALKKDIAVYVEDEKIREIMLEGLKNRIIEDAKPPSRKVLLSDRTTILDDANQNEK
jgi:hypothetical protein